MKILNLSLATFHCMPERFRQEGADPGRRRGEGWSGPTPTPSDMFVHVALKIG